MSESKFRAFIIKMMLEGKLHQANGKEVVGGVQRV